MGLAVPTFRHLVRCPLADMAPTQRPTAHALATMVMGQCTLGGVWCPMVQRTGALPNMWHNPPYNRACALTPLLELVAYLPQSMARFLGGMVPPCQNVAKPGKWRGYGAHFMFTGANISHRRHPSGTPLPTTGTSGVASIPHAAQHDNITRCFAHATQNDGRCSQLHTATHTPLVSKAATKSGKPESDPKQIARTGGLACPMAQE